MGNSYWPKKQEKGIPHVVCGCLLTVCCWRFARLVVGGVGGLRRWRFARWAVGGLGVGGLGVGGLGVGGLGVGGLGVGGLGVGGLGVGGLGVGGLSGWRFGRLGVTAVGGLGG